VLDGKFGGARISFIGPAIGAEKLGYNVTAVPRAAGRSPFTTTA
jgi:hypothetical protein